MKIQFKQQLLSKFWLSMASKYKMLSQNAATFCNNISMQNSIFSTYQYDDQIQI